MCIVYITELITTSALVAVWRWCWLMCPSITRHQRTWRVFISWSARNWNLLRRVLLTGQESSGSGITISNCFIYKIELRSDAADNNLRDSTFIHRMRVPTKSEWKNPQQKPTKYIFLIDLCLYLQDSFMPHVHACRDSNVPFSVYYGNVFNFAFCFELSHNLVK